MKNSIEEKWKKRWKKSKIFEAKEGKGKKYYVLEMYPYPSAVAAHVGHARNYVIGDSFARFMRMLGFNVLYPMGWDAFGQPSENAAIDMGIHPSVSVAESIKTMKDQFDALSLSYDWSKEITTCDPEYYKWNQWLFLKLLESGLAYKKFALGNWCPKCETVLANEDVKEGRCWRCEAEVIQKEINQWFFKITDYADRLLEDLNKIEWSERLKTMQTNWIGKSKGVNYFFKVKGMNLKIKTFTTRPDTYFGITFMVIAPEHPLVKELTTDSKNKKEIEKFIEESKKLTEMQRTLLEKEKKGIFTGKYAINPVTKKEIPIWIANYVVATYGTGIVIGVPAQDQRDFEFALKYDIPIKQVIKPKTSKSVVLGLSVEKGFKEELNKNSINFEVGLSSSNREHIRVTLEDNQIDNYIRIVNKFIKKDWWVEIIGSRNIFIMNEKVIDNFLENKELFEVCKKHEPLVRKYKNMWDMLNDNSFYHGFICYTDEGIIVNSRQFDGMNSKDAMKAIADFLVKEKHAEFTVNYKIRDWCISRQKYWGTPIPIIYCKKCGIVPVPEKDLPVILPLNVKFGKKGAPPLATNKKFVNTKCPKCKGPATRETDTMTTFVDSAWYFLRYTSPHYKKALFDKEKIKYWLPVDQYIGGTEHAVGHLMYSRFITKFLKDKGYLNFDEPFLRLLNQGMVKKNGVKMSKSKGNTVDPRSIIKEHGVDALRTYLLFMADPTKDVEWSDKEMSGVSSFLKRIVKMKDEMKKAEGDRYIDSVTQRKIESVTNALKKLEQNVAILELMDFSNKLSKHPSLYSYKILLKMLTPFAPHTTEELWESLGEKKIISVQKWPEPDAPKISLKEEAGEEFISNIVKDVEEIKRLSGIESPKKITIFVAPLWKHDVYDKVLQNIELKDVIKDYKGKEKEVVGYYNKLQKKKPLEEKFLKGHELKHLELSKDFLEKELKTKIEIIPAEKSSHPKAFAAEPEKPGILVE